MALQVRLRQHFASAVNFLDEYEYEAEDPIAEEVGEMVVKAIAWAGKFLKLNVPLAGEAKIGKSWKETH